MAGLSCDDYYNTPARPEQHIAATVWNLHDW